MIAPVNMGLFGLLALFAGARLQASYTASPAQKQFMPEEKIVVQFSLLAVGVVEMINSISLWVEKGLVRVICNLRRYKLITTLKTTFWKNADTMCGDLRFTWRASFVLSLH